MPSEQPQRQELEELKLAADDYRYRDQLMVTEFALTMTTVGIALNGIGGLADKFPKVLVLFGLLLFLLIVSFHLYRINADRVAAGTRKKEIQTALGMKILQGGFAGTRRLQRFKIGVPQLMVWFTHLITVAVAVAIVVVWRG